VKNLRREPQNRISPKAVTVWKITAAIWSIVELLVIIGISLLIFFFQLAEMDYS